MNGTVPLTPEQRNWLRANSILPTLFATPMVCILAVVFALVYRRFGGALPVKIFVGFGALLLIAVTVAVVLHVRNNAKDSLRGVAEVATAQLTGKRERGRSPKSLYADFEGIGSFIVLSDVYTKLVVGRPYRITFSPHTRRCWTADER